MMTSGAPATQPAGQASTVAIGEESTVAIGQASSVATGQASTVPGGEAVGQPAGEWAGPDPRYRGYRPVAGGVRLDHRVRRAVELMPRPGSAAQGGRLLDLGGGDGYVTATLGAVVGARLAVVADVGAPAPLAVLPRPVTRVTVRLPGPLPFAAGSFDVVVSLETIEHLLDPDALLAEARRVLAPGGCLVLSTPRLDALLVIGSLILGVQPPGIEASSRRRYGNPFGEQRPSGHVHLFTRRALAEALSANGFRLAAYREGRFSSSWWQAVRSDRRPGWRDLVVGAVFAVYDLVPFRKDVMVVRAVADG